MEFESFDVLKEDGLLLVFGDGNLKVQSGSREAFFSYDSAPWADTPTPQPKLGPLDDRVHYSADTPAHQQIHLCVLEAPTPEQNYIPSLYASYMLEAGNIVIAECKYIYSDSEPHLFLWADDTVTDMLISIVRETEDGFIETTALVYVPEIAARQAVSLVDIYGGFYSEGDYCRIAYTNASGEYEATLLLYDDNAAPMLVPTEPKLVNEVFDRFYFENDYFMNSDSFPKDIYDMIKAGDFDDHIPKGLCIKEASLGDINGDGVMDALLSLKTAGHHAAAYGSEVPMFLLLGQPGGGFIVEQKIPDVLYDYYRSYSYAIAGNGFIDIVYDINGGLACHHTYVSRFWYDEAENDWLLKEFYYQSSFTMDASTFVRALPEFEDLPLSEFVKARLHSGYKMTDVDYFDTISVIPVTSSDGSYYMSYTIAVKIDRTGKYYEGYILEKFESIDLEGFVQTIRGKYRPGSPVTIIANKDDCSFTIQGDTWIRSFDDIDEFLLVEQVF